MTKKRGKKAKKLPWPHVLTKDACYVYVESGWPTVMGVPHRVEEVYGNYPVRFVRLEADLESLESK